MADSTAPPRFTRRTFLGWWMASLLTSTVVVGLAPILVFLWPAPPKGQKKLAVTVALDKPVDQLANGEAVKFDAPSSTNKVFVLAFGCVDKDPSALSMGWFVMQE